MLPTLVADIWPGPASSSVGQIVAVGRRLFFVANDGIHGTELWTSRGTPATTHIVRDIWKGSGSSGPGNLTKVAGTLYFTADDGLKGNELWKSDGTAAGTVLVRDVVPGPHEGRITDLVAVGSRLYFSVSAGRTKYPALWKSDGTKAGTRLVRSWTVENGKPPSEITAVGSRVFFVFSYRLWMSDGTAVGTIRVKPHNAFSAPEQLVAVGSRLFFTAYPPGGGCAPPDRELWVTDGSKASLKDLGRAGVGGVSFNGQFWYGGPGGAELWKSDGTVKGTALVRTVDYGPAQLTVVGRRLFFTTSNNGEYDNPTSVSLWRSTGTAAGTAPLKTFTTTDPHSTLAIETLVNVNGQLMFYAREPINGNELWKSDGTKAGTVICTDMDPSGPLWPSQLTSLGNRVFFTASGAGVGVGEELWTYTP